MAAIQSVDIGPIKELLRNVAPSKAGQLDELFDRLSPICELDRSDERILFQADTERKLIRIGTKCTIRLQAHALAAGVIITGIGSSGLKDMQPHARHKLFHPADRLLTWAVGRDLQQWLKQIEGRSRDLGTILRGAESDLPDELLASLGEKQRLFGEALFRFAFAFILLHEIAHLNFGHGRVSGYWSIQQEKDADWFAAEWLLDAASQKQLNPRARRLNMLFGISIALLWLTVFNVYLGRSQSISHPQGYDRLFQVLDRGVDPADEEESLMLWYLVSTLLFIHMDSAGFDLKPEYFRSTDPRGEVNALIDIISKRDQR